jgi:ABC-type sugar transport system ATPase subunit
MMRGAIAAFDIPATGPVISVRGLTKTYGAVEALRDVSLDFHAGEIHAVVGENGAGKSTLSGFCQ